MVDELSTDGVLLVLHIYHHMMKTQTELLCVLCDLVTDLVSDKKHFVY